MTFETLRLSEPILRAIAAEGYTSPTPIQRQAIPHILAARDLLGCARTGTGKTAAFAMPILDRLRDRRREHRSPSDRRARAPRALVLAPTRELASQIAESFAAYGRHVPLRCLAIFGGVSQHHQVRSLERGIDILVATPGRLMDLMGQGHVHLRGVEVLVLDEADRMLDMGFLPDIRRIAKSLPEVGGRQTLLFSATMPDEIRRLASTLLHNPEHVQVDPVSSAVDHVTQAVFFVSNRERGALLRGLLRTEGDRTLVFTRTKRGADRVVKDLVRGGISAEAIHSNKSQNARTRALEGFRSCRTRVLVATDIASRGIDVDEITHVINYDLPELAETYVHRIGRTGRAGATGCAITFCDHSQRDELRAIERLTRAEIIVRSDIAKIVSRAVEMDAAGAGDDQDDQPDERRRFVPRGRQNGAGPRNGAGGTNGSNGSRRTTPSSSGEPGEARRRRRKPRRSRSAGNGGADTRHRAPGAPKPRSQGATATAPRRAPSERDGGGGGGFTPAGQTSHRGRSFQHRGRNASRRKGRGCGGRMGPR